MHLTAGGTPVAVKRRTVNRSTKVRTPLYFLVYSQLTAVFKYLSHTLPPKLKIHPLKAFENNIVYYSISLEETFSLRHCI
jgi:hypothetical protein